MPLMLKLFGGNTEVPVIIADKVRSPDNSGLHVWRNTTSWNSFSPVLNLKIRHAGKLNSNHLRVLGLAPLFVGILIP